MRLTTLLIGAFPLFAYEPPSASQFRAHVAAQMRSLPNYTCLQETTRTVREPGERKFERVDTVRLEVVLANDRELFAWPGDSNFADASIEEIVRGGAIASGFFGLFTRQIFTSRAVDLQVSDGGWFDFRVPQILSGYTLTSASGSSVSGYLGRAWADPATHDLRKLTLSATDIASEHEYLSIQYSIEYGSGALPVTSTATLMHRSGKEYRNETKFSACREFKGESTLLVENVSSRITSEAPAPASVPKAALPAPRTKVSARAPLPPGVEVELRLQSALDHKTTAVGDTVPAVVAMDVIHEGKVVLDKGSVLTGRVHRFERQGPEAYLVSIRFPFRGNLIFVERKKRVIRDVGGIGSYGRDAPRTDYVTDPLTEWERENATFFTPQQKLGKGFTMKWVTSR